jgi:hypothetical protein
MTLPTESKQPKKERRGRQFVNWPDGHTRIGERMGRGLGWLRYVHKKLTERATTAMVVVTAAATAVMVHNLDLAAAAPESATAAVVVVHDLKCSSRNIATQGVR